MRRVVMLLISAVTFVTVLTVLTNSGFGDTPVLKWDDAAGTNVWNSSVTNWLDSTESNVVWQSGAQALFEGSGTAVYLEENISAAGLSFDGSGYVLSGTNLLTVEGAIATSNTTENTIASALYSAAGIDKTGDGTLILSNPNLTLYATLNASEGTLALQDTSIPGTVAVNNPAGLSVLPSATNGLTGFYYSITRTDSDFASLVAMEAHFSRYTPNLAASSSLAGPTFDFGNGALFPDPYGTGGSRDEYFEVVWRGTITIPESDNYKFRVTHDDGFLLAFDGKMVKNNLGNSTTEIPVHLDAGSHDMVLGLYQGTGASGMKIEVKTVDESYYTTLPNSWLSPYTSVNSLSGDGTITADSDSSFNMKQVPSTTSTFTGAIDTQSGSIFTKSGWGDLTLVPSGATSNTIAGDVAVMGGGLKLSMPEQIGNSSKLTVGGESFIKLPEDETIESLAGSGTVILGGSSQLFISEFTSDANSGISTNKTYTHLLDFPADNLPATVNDVTFIAAGMNGSTNGYSWSTVVPPTGAWGNAYTGLDQLLNDFYYNSANFTLTLSGLTPGQNYEMRLYFRCFGTNPNPSSPRKLNFSLTAGEVYMGSIEYNPDTIAKSALVCRYTADASGTLSIRAIAHSTGDTCHVYALSNEETGDEAVVQIDPATAPEAVEFSGDAGSGISAQKTYTHKLDFPGNGNPATVNGVSFVAAGMSGSSDGYYWSTSGTAPTAPWNGSPYDYFYNGVERLLWDFIYNSMDFTVNLSGLHPGQAYETRLYFRSFGSVKTDPESNRDVTFTFTAGGTSLGSVDHDLDTMAQSMVRCSYTADSAGTISIRVQSHNSGSTCHLYGLTNEELYKPATLTINTPSGTSAFHTGAILGSGTIVKQGEGTQTLACANRLSAPLDVQEGTLAFAPGASVEGGLTVATGATVAAPKGNVQICGLSGTGTFSLAPDSTSPVEGMISITYFTNDVMTGISPSKTYTHLMDLGDRSIVAEINGVSFNKVSSQSGSINGYGWSNFPPSHHPGTALTAGHDVPIDSGVYNLLYDMDYGWSYPAPQTMQLTGLIPGRQYEVHLFNRPWGWGGDRTQTVTFDTDGTGPVSESVVFNPDQMEPNFIAYRYTAVSTTLDIIIQSKLNNQTLHLYGLTNEEVSDPTVLKITEDTVFPGDISGSGVWTKSGAGTLTLTGTGDASGSLTVTEGALGISNGGTATTGDISVEAGAALFGDGTVGGDVIVTSNALIYAGTADTCGTLETGAGLTLEPGAQPVWRYQSGGADTIIVNGLLTFPTNGVLQAESLTPGIYPPDIAVVFSSTQPIEGPDDLTGWTVEGEVVSALSYSGDHTKIYFIRTNGTLIMIR